MAQDVKLKIGGDATELVNSVKAAMAQIQKEVEKLKVPNIPTVSSYRASRQESSIAEPGSKEFQDRFQRNREKFRERADDQAALNIANSALIAKNRQIDELSRKQKSVVSDKRAEAEYDERINKALKERQSIQITIGQLQKDLYGDEKREHSTGRGILKALGGKGIIKGASSSAAAIMGGAYLGSKLMEQYENVRSFLTNTQERTTVTETNAFQATYGRELQNIASGKGMEELAFFPERREAAKRAESMMKGKFESAFGTETMKQAADTGSTGASLMLLIKSVVSQSASEALFGNEQSYQAQKAKEYSALEAEQLAALKGGASGTFKSMAVGQFMGNLQGDVNFQRSLGLNFQQFRGAGGFIQNIAAAGFTPEMAMQASQGILNAGGSTLGARESGFALRTQRAFDLTNAPQIMGKLTGALGTEDSKHAMIDMLASGTALGLDKSDYREENRKYLEALSSIIARSGAKTNEDFDRLAGAFSGFVTEKTPAGITAAQSAYQLYQQSSTEKTGPRAVMRQAALLNSDVYGKLSFTTQQALSLLTPEQMVASHPSVIQAAAEARTTPEKIIEAYSKAQRSSMMVWDVSKGKRLQNEATKAAGGISGINSLGDPTLTKMYDAQVAKTRGAYGTYLAAQPGFEALADPRTMRAFEKAMENKPPGQEQQALREAKDLIQKDIEGAAKRPEDLAIAGQAQFSSEMNRNILDFKDSLAPATDAVKEFAQSIMAAAMASKGATQEEIAAARQNIGLTSGQKRDAADFANSLSDIFNNRNASSMQNQGISPGSANMPNSSGG